MTNGEIDARPTCGCLCHLGRGKRRSCCLDCDPLAVIPRELADLARLIDRADAEASRLRARRLVAWRAAREAGLSWRAIAAASGGMDHAQIAKTVNALRKGTD